MKLRTVFLLFKLLPVPVNFNVFLVRSDHFVLDFIGTVLFVFIFLFASSILNVVDVVFYSGDCFISLESHLNQTA